ncbi:MAG: helix-turn-helix transcriptional regulator [Candidatus Heimdallarchaeota archaeon]
MVDSRNRKLTLLRQWAMLRYIPRMPRKIPASRLLSLLENDGYDVSKRTIERDLMSMTEVFTSLQCDKRNKPYGWSWFGNDIMDIPSMDTPVALSFAITSRFMQPLLPRSNIRHLEPHFLQAEKVLSNTEKSDHGKWLDKIRILHRGQKLISADISPEILDTVYEALMTDKCLDIEYQKASNDKITEYEVNPLGLVFRDATIYLVSTLWKFEHVKQLVLHRIKTATISDKSKRIPKGFTLDKYIDSGEFGYKVTEKKIKLKVLFETEAVSHLRETRLSEDQTIKDQYDERALLEATVLDTLELRWWLRGFGDLVEIVKPKRLRDEFTNMSKNLAKIYSSAT